MFKFIRDWLADRYLERQLLKFGDTPIEYQPLVVVDFDTVYRKMLDNNYYSRLPQLLVNKPDMIHLGP